eukprot:365272-Chlamydomonas_euryale.AAC.11
MGRLPVPQSECTAMGPCRRAFPPSAPWPASPTACKLAHSMDARSFSGEARAVARNARPAARTWGGGRRRKGCSSPPWSAVVLHPFTDPCGKGRTQHAAFMQTPTCTCAPPAKALTA